MLTSLSGNADAYRVTREIPLPYRRTEQDSDVDDDFKPAKDSNLTKLRQKVLGRTSEGRGANALNVGARGHARQREYEASRPGDFPAPASSGEDNV